MLPTVLPLATFGIKWRWACPKLQLFPRWSIEIQRFNSFRSKTKQPLHNRPHRLAQRWSHSTSSDVAALGTVQDELWLRRVETQSDCPPRTVSF